MGNRAFPQKISKVKRNLKISVIIDEIYTQLALFMPQLIVNRRDIKIEADRAKLYCRFKATNQANFKTDTYSLVLYDEDIQK